MARLQIDVISPRELTAAQEAAWIACQAAGPGPHSPFYSLGFMKAVARHRQDLRLGVLSGDGTIMGFLPFHRRGGGRAAPLAAPISDAQGVIGTVPAGTTAGELLRGCGMTCYDYDHAPGDAPLFQDHAFRRTTSPLIDLEAGAEAWLAARRASGSALKTVARKIRKIEREIGPLRFEAQNRSENAWALFLDWKRTALAAMGVRSVLDQPWTRAVIEEIRTTQTAGFAGLFSTLHAGDRLVAAHFGMRSHNTWHWWFPSYDPHMSAYTPGLALLLGCVRHAGETGIGTIDLGRGDERYKQEFANAARPLCEGSLERPAAWHGLARRIRKGLYHHAEGHLPAHVVDLKRRAFNRLLRVGRL